MIKFCIPGTIEQTYNEQGLCVRQEFIQNNDEHWEDEDGEIIEKPDNIEDFPQELIQPESMD